MTALAHPPHPVATAVASARAEIAGVDTTALWSMDAAQTAAALDEVEAGEAQLRALKSRLLVHAETIDLPAQAGRGLDGELAGPPQQADPSGGAPADPVGQGPRCARPHP